MTKIVILGITIAAAVLMTTTTGGCSSSENANPNAPRGDGGALAPSGLSSAFDNVCARCHGDRGQGQTLNGVVYPVIPGGKDENAFIAVVRSGRGDMPAADETQISDADLKADYAALKKLHP